MLNRRIQILLQYSYNCNVILALPCCPRSEQTVAVWWKNSDVCGGQQFAEYAFGFSDVSGVINDLCSSVISVIPIDDYRRLKLRNGV